MCDDREKLIAYLYDEASASERREVDAHLAGCAECREELRGLRSVRQDLLAWDVPEHESVWKPFVNPVATVWWKQVPAWGLAAAATLIFGLGMAGGMAARALAGAPVVMQAQAPASTQPQTATPQTIAATPEQVRALEERLASLERIASQGTVLGPEATHVSNTTGAGNVDEATLRRFDQMLKDTEQRINQKWSQRVISMSTDIYKQSQRDKADLTRQISEAQAQTYGNLARVANRGTLEKEKE